MFLPHPERRVRLSFSSFLRPALRAALVVAAAVTLWSCSDDDGPVSPQAWEHATLEARTLELINAHRATLGKPALTLLDVITQQARTHSVNMAAGTVPFSHEGFAARVEVIGKSIPHSSAGENVAWNNFPDPAQQAVTGWLNSPPHRQNIEGDYDATGIGIAKSANGSTYFTQIFIKRR